MCIIYIWNLSKVLLYMAEKKETKENIIFWGP